MFQLIKNFYHAGQALGSHIWHGFPSKKLTLIGVTGTDGKTTTVHLIHAILQAAGRKVALISTIGAKIGQEEVDTGLHVTTPDPWEVPKLIGKAVNQGCDSLVMEVSSHGLSQNRVFGCQFAIGVLTNVSHEHLDYHKTFENYLMAKVKLLQMAETAVLNVDDPWYAQVKALLPSSKIFTFGKKNKAFLTPKTFPFKTILPGVYNQYNCLAAIAVACTLKLPDKAIRQGIAKFEGLPGRFEKVPNKKGIHLIIDFAHKPNALKSVLEEAKTMFSPGRIIAVFGAAGERDSLKRPMMGQMAAKYADVSVLTAEDPRSESVDDIIEEIAQGLRRGGTKEIKKQDGIKFSAYLPCFIRIPDRQEAITLAIRHLAKRGDCVLLLGKGHEKSMCYGRIEYPWSEHAAVKIAFKV